MHESTPSETNNKFHVGRDILASLQRRYENELFERVIPFWVKHSPDRKHGGFFNCLDADGAVYDRTKHVWLQGRQVWMLSKLYRTVEQRQDWLDLATLGVEFLRKYAVEADGKVLFALSEDGAPVARQRKMYGACFYVLALAEYARAADKPSYMTEAKQMLEKIWHWAFHPQELGRVALSGEIPMQTLAVPMILLNLFEEVSGLPEIEICPQKNLRQINEYSAEINECINLMQKHINHATQLVYENVQSDGTLVDSPAGRLLNPGHAIEGGWFLQHWAQRLGRNDLLGQALAMARWSQEAGWDKKYGGIYYFLDAKGYSPTQLEWQMKLWWPHCEALYAHLLNYALTGERSDWELFTTVDNYTFARFPDRVHGEWFGYLDRQGEVTHRFKGGPYKGCFHVPRALWLCWNLLRKLQSNISHKIEEAYNL